MSDFVNIFRDKYTRLLLSEATIWVLFLFFFTYSCLFSSVLTADQSVVSEYFKMHENFVTAVANLGMISMIFIDSTYEKKYISKKLVKALLISIALIFIICGHAKCHSDIDHEPHKYVDFVYYNIISYICLALLAGFAVYMRYITIKPEETKEVDIVN